MNIVHINIECGDKIICKLQFDILMLKKYSVIKPSTFK